MAIPPLQYRAVFISDLHLGSAACKIDEFNEFLNTIHCESLYLVGDIIDVWMVVKKGKWRPEHTTAIRRLLGKSQHNCTVYYLPGNHDTFARNVGSLELGSIRVADTFVHETADGKRLLIIHGDQFDASVKSFTLAFVGAWAYEASTMIRLATRKPKSGSGKLKKSFKKLISIMGKYEEKLVLAAQTEDCEGVICGHIHRPDLRSIDDVIYGNTGDWVESCTCIVEHFDGRLELLTWDKMKRLAAIETGMPIEEPEASHAPKAPYHFLSKVGRKRSPRTYSRTSLKSLLSPRVR